jgi:ABC-type Fe3+ transport system permease subunit
LVWIYAVLFFPFAARLTQPALARVDRDLLDDAALCGAGSLACFRIVVWPSLREPAAAGAILVLLLAGREIDATALLRVPDGDTVAFRVYDYLHFAPGPNVAALSVLIVLAGAAVTGLFAFWLRLGRDE